MEIHRGRSTGQWVRLPIFGVAIFFVLGIGWWFLFGRTRSIISPVPEEPVFEVIYYTPTPLPASPTASASATPTKETAAKPTQKPTASPTPKDSTDKTSSPSPSPSKSPTPTPSVSPSGTPTPTPTE